MKARCLLAVATSQKHGSELAHVLVEDISWVIKLSHLMNACSLCFVYAICMLATAGHECTHLHLLRLNEQQHGAVVNVWGLFNG